MAAKPGAETPTMTGNFTRWSTRFTMPTDSSCAIFGASPSWPRTVTPSPPASMKKSVMRPIDDSSMRPSGWKGVGAMTYTPFASLVSFIADRALSLLPGFFVPGLVLGVGRIEAGEHMPLLDLVHDPPLEPLLLRRGRDHLLDERGRDHHGAVVVHDDPVVGEHGHAAAADGLAPVHEGEAAHGRRRGGALAPNGELRRAHAGHVAHHAIGDECGDPALLHAGAQDVAEDARVRDAHRVGHADAPFRHGLDRRARRDRFGPGLGRGEVLAGRHEAQRERLADEPRLARVERARAPHPDVAQTLLDHEGRDGGGGDFLQRGDDL